MAPIYVKFTNYLPSLHIIDKYYDILATLHNNKPSEVKYETNESNSEIKISSLILKSIKLTWKSLYI